MLLQQFTELGLNMGSPKIQKPEGTVEVFAGKTVVVTGTLPTLGREEANQLVRDNGGKASGSVSKKTDYVLAGEKAGSKLTKAEELGIAILTEEKFLAMIQR